MVEPIEFFNDGSDMFAIAKAYGEFGWSVLPVAPGTKAPAVNWKKYQTQPPLSGELEVWFKGKTSKQIGITLVTGETSGVTVVDIDDSGSTYGIPEGLHVRSGKGGRHYYYQYEPGVKTNSKISGKPIDIRNDGAVIVLPPTIHPIGVPYTWQKGGALPQFPTSFWQESFPALHSQEGQFDDVSMSATDFALELVQFKTLTPGDGRNDKLVMLLGKLRRHLNDQGIFEALARYIALTADHKLSNKEVTAMLKQALHWKGSPAIVLPREIVSKESLANDLVRLKELERIAPKTGYDDLDREITGFLPGNVYMLSGETNAGKTQMAANLAYNVAKQGKRVLYIALEPQERILNYFCSIDGKIGYSQVTPEAIGKMSPVLDQIDFIKNCSSLEELKETLEGLDGYSLIVLDHIGYFTSDTGKKDSLQAQSDLMKRLPALAREKKCAVLAIAHVRKKSTQTVKKKSRPLDGFDIVGSGAFIQDATDVLLIRRYYEDETPDSEDNRFKPEGGIIVYKTKSPQKGATGYAGLYFTPESAYIAKLASFTALPKPKRVTASAVKDMFKDM